MDVIAENLRGLSIGENSGAENEVSDAGVLDPTGEQVPQSDDARVQDRHGSVKGGRDRRPVASGLADMTSEVLR